MEFDELRHSTNFRPDALPLIIIRVQAGLQTHDVTPNLTASC